MDALEDDHDLDLLEDDDELVEESKPAEPTETEQKAKKIDPNKRLNTGGGKKVTLGPLLAQSLEKISVNKPEDTTTKKNARTERFGVESPGDKLKNRRERFTSVTDEKKKERQTRFAALGDTDEKKAQRLERFGAVQPTKTASTEAKDKRKERFGTVSPTAKRSAGAAGIVTEEDRAKRAKRSERFTAAK